VLTGAGKKQSAALLYHQRVVEERNPYKFIEKTLAEARVKLEKMRDTPKLIDTITDVSTLNMVGVTACRVGRRRSS
jgi:5-bromo-4-chloroindolyl phosphate hydrolysis protein